MFDWWNSLTGATLFFWTVAIGASVFQLLLFAGSMFGGHDFDHSADVGSEHAPIAGAEGAVKVLSLRAMVAFAVGFGWAGVLFIDEGFSLTVTIAIAMFVGLLFMGMIYGVMRFMVSLKADGTLDYANAVGLEGKVYITIPAARAGEGQIELLLQGRLITVTAVTSHSQPLPPHASVRVDSVEGNTLVVSPAH
jgi:membrane protein implicated in regulation of membrane protease activity